MIARIWKGKTPHKYSDVYTEIIETRDLPDYSQTKGFVKFSLLKRSDDRYTYFKIITIWKDMEAVKNFTGSDPHKAVGHKEDEKYVTDFPGNVWHYDVIID